MDFPSLIKFGVFSVFNAFIVVAVIKFLPVFARWASNKLISWF